MYKNGQKFMVVKNMQSKMSISVDGVTIWTLPNGDFHRVDGPAIEFADGSKQWWAHGKRHREDGPATEWDSGRRAWFVGGKRHRADGPAIEWPNGEKTWHSNGKHIFWTDK